ncbi:multidrug export protein EmrA, partial [Morganella morganii]
MSVSEETQAVQPPVRNKKRQRRNALMLLTLLFVLLGAAYTVYWFMVLR